MELKSIFILIVDISGYTRFIKKHKVALLHAEKIVGDLMEAVLDRVQAPVVAHEILGDAVSLYAEDRGDPRTADQIYEQTLQYFDSFREKEAALISDCQVCSCEACEDIGKLKLKAIMHHGEAAFTMVRDIRKISGENVILAHRLLKNSIESNEYILMTQDFANRCDDMDSENEGFVHLTEHCEGIGPVKIAVKNFEPFDPVPKPFSRMQKMKNLFSLFVYTTPRLMFGSMIPKSGQFRNLPQ